MSEKQITISIVSHRQNTLVNSLLADIAKYCSARVSVIVTENTNDEVPIDHDLTVSGAQIVVNRIPKGFGANHNEAFTRCRTPFFCVVNPDVRLSSNPFDSLTQVLAMPAKGIVGPKVVNSQGQLENSARKFPRIRTLLKKAVSPTPGPDYPIDQGAVVVDWIAGMFMLFSREGYEAVHGFDERYFLYYEDVDICRRLGKIGIRTIYDPRITIIHDAQRASRRKIRMALHHARSMVRFLTAAP